jgi:hypothetical protein
LQKTINGNIRWVRAEPPEKKIPKNA